MNKHKSHITYFSSVPTHDGGEAESKAQSQGHLAGHAAPFLRLSKEDDGAKEGYHQWNEQCETQQSIIGFHQRGANVHHKHHLDKVEQKTNQTHLTFYFCNILSKKKSDVIIRRYSTFPGANLTMTTMVTRAPKAEIAMRVIPSGSSNARNSIIFGTQVSWASLDQ